MRGEGQAVMEWACSPSATKPVSSLINYGNYTSLNRWRRLVERSAERARQGGNGERKMKWRKRVMEGYREGCPEARSMKEGAQESRVNAMYMVMKDFRVRDET